MVVKPKPASVAFRGGRRQRLFHRGGRMKGQEEAVDSYKRG